MSLTLILLPFLGALTIWLQDWNNVYEVRKTALFFSVLTYFVCIVIWITFDPQVLEIQFVNEITDWSLGQLAFGIDYLSLWFIILTSITIPLVILSSFHINSNVSQSQLYIILMLIFEGFIIIVFISIDILMFYVSFEAVLIPLSLLTGIYGGQKRIQAAFLLFLYTLIGSLPMLLGILKIYSMTGTTHMTILSFLNCEYNHITWLAIFLALAVKSPSVPFHLWLKTAHAEANVATSIILAGVVLKMATYGYLRLLIHLMPNETSYFQNLIAVTCLISVVYTAFSCLRQSDFKQLIAYSSINHMAIVNLAIFSNTVTGIEGGILLSLAHGIASPALFFLAGGVLYDRYHNRTIRYFRGLTLYMPVFSIFFFIFLLGNIAVPLTANWAGEFLSLAGAFQTFPIITCLASSTIVLSACYSIYLFNRMCFGNWSIYLTPVIDIQRIEFHVVLPLAILLFLVGLYPNFILDYLHIGTSSLIY